MGDKTPAQIQADADAAKAQQDAQTARDQSGAFNSIGNLFSGIGDFFGGFMGLIEVALVAGLAYWASTTEWGKNAISGLIDMLPESWKATLTGLANKIGIDIDMGASLEAMDYAKFHETLKGQGVPEEVAEAIDPNDNNQTLKSVLDIIRQANGGKVTLSGFTSPATITALIQQKPDIALKLVTALKSGAPNGEESAIAKAARVSIKTIIANEQLDELLSDQYRAGTIKVLAAALPADAPLNADALRIIIEKDLAANGGKPSDNLRKLFTDAIEAGTATDAEKAKAGIQADALAIVGAKDAATLLDPAKVAATAGKDAGYVVRMIQNDAHAKAAYGALVDTLGNDKASALLAAMNGADANTKITQLLLTKENVHALPQAVALLNALPGLQSPTLNTAREFLTPAHIPAITAMVNNGAYPVAISNNFLKDGKFDAARAVDMLMDSRVRTALNQAGTDNVAALLHDKNPLLSQHNIDALITFGGALEASRNAQHLAPERIRQDAAVIHRIARIASGEPITTALKGLSSGQIAAFFSVPANRAAFNTLLHTLAADPKMPAAQREELALLRKDFDQGSGVGLGAILSDAESVKFLLGNAEGKGNWFTGIEFVQRRAMEWQGGDTLDNTQNQDILLELGKVINGASAGAAAPAAAPAAGRRPAPAGPTH